MLCNYVMLMELYCAMMSLCYDNIIVIICDYIILAQLWCVTVMLI